MPGPASLSPDVLKYHEEEGGVEDQDKRRWLEEWCTGVQADDGQIPDDLYEHQEISALDEVSTQDFPMTICNNAH